MLPPDIKEDGCLRMIADVEGNSFHKKMHLETQ